MMAHSPINPCDDFAASRSQGGYIQSDKPRLTRRMLSTLKTNPQHMLHQSVRCNWQKIVECCGLYTELYAYAFAHDDSNDITDQDSIDEFTLFAPLKQQDKTLLKAKVHSLISQQLYEEDPWGNTALHAALHHGSGEPTVQVIRCMLDLERTIQQQQQQQQQEDTPSKPLLLRQNARGQTPLHVGCDNGSKISILQVLLDDSSYSQASMAMFIPDHAGSTVLDAVLHYYELWLHVPILREVNPPIAKFTAETVRSEPSNKSKLSLDFWNRLDLLLQAAFWSAPLNSEDGVDIIQMGSALPSLLHAAAYCTTIIPPRLAEALFRVHQDQNNDNDDITPLHVLVSTPFPQQLSQDHQATFLNNRKRFMQLCLKNECANSTNSRQLFHQAVASGFIWNEDDFNSEETTATDDDDTTTADREQPLDSEVKVTRRDSFTSIASSSSSSSSTTSDEDSQFNIDSESIFQTRLDTTSALSLLWDRISVESPSVASEKDPATGLYPFHLASMAATASDNANTLDTIYQLLRVYPQVIQEGL